MAEKKTSLIRSVIVPGRLDHFRAVMQRLIIQYKQETWQSSTGEHLFFGETRQTKQEVIGVQDMTLPFNQPTRWSRPVSRTVDVTPSTRGTWQVHANLFQDKHTFAAIEAYEQPDGQSTRLDFIDGYYPRSHTARDQIGASFVEFAEMIIYEVQAVQGHDAGLSNPSLTMAGNRQDTHLLSKDTKPEAAQPVLTSACDGLGLPTATERKAILDAIDRANKKARGLVPKWELIRDELSYTDFTEDKGAPSVPTLRDKIRAMWNNQTARDEIKARDLDDVIETLATRKRK